MIRIGNAPCSWGVEFADDPRNPSWRKVLSDCAAAGYKGIELGPVGFMPEGSAILADGLAENDLTLIGGVVFRPFHDATKWDDVWDGATRTCKALVAHGAKHLVLIDSISPRRAPTAGRAAEALIFGEVSAGAGGSLASDLSQATRRALMIETNWGLGDLGPIWMPAPETVLLTDEQLRNRVRARMEAAEERALAILTTHRANLISLAETLLDKRSMGADEILPWVHAVQAHDPQAIEAPPAADKAPPAS